ncbi:50S ribosomal protein L23 [Mycoplasmopsis bovigenitalium 51080]|uniref:Large ribosomal subunit protein uL23 n=1 Tax=Mycoplasmopsis bovigenitalium 51080 TaxID=1188235 RepID=N9TRU0_9BACT|nr:50S ribosomal protein L23 [Mycoplasmopsis bovigenitalium]ENY68780.1 50S ribosomal protein L23 [Mycoplasmopsis bovigenitalium 51080]
MELTQVIRKPILTEKTNLLQAQNKYTFEVDYHANKFQIKQAVEFIFQVKVVSVNTIKVDKKAKRVGRFNGFTNRYKKAIVTLAQDDKIVFYPNEAEAQDEAKKEIKQAKAKAQKQADADAEEKLAQKIAAKKTTKKVAKKEV